jgi:hypothetical protein
MAWHIQVYASTSRDNLLAAVRDVLQTEVGGYSLLTTYISSEITVWIAVI